MVCTHACSEEVSLSFVFDCLPRLFVGRTDTDLGAAHFIVVFVNEQDIFACDDDCVVSGDVVWRKKRYTVYTQKRLNPTVMGVCFDDNLLEWDRMIYRLATSAGIENSRYGDCKYRDCVVVFGWSFVVGRGGY